MFTDETDSRSDNAEAGQKMDIPDQVNPFGDEDSEE